MKYKFLFGALLLTVSALGQQAAGQQRTYLPYSLGPGNLSGGIIGPGDKSDIVIVLTNTANNMTYRTNAQADGLFHTTVPPGTYRVEVERDGVRHAVPQTVQIVSGNTRQMSFRLDLGAPTETVEIDAKAPAQQDDPPDRGRSFATRNVREYPVADRNYQELNGLVSGINPPSINFNHALDPQQGRVFNTDGLAAYTNDQKIEGISIREPMTGVLSTHILPDEAIQQLNIRTSNYSVDQGFTSGAVSNVFTRPGTNGFHGSLFGFWTSDALQTRNPLQPANVGSPRLHDWQYGATGGGALMPNNAFFFASYQGTRNSADQLQFASVPTPAMLAGNFSGTGVTIFNPFTGTAAGTGRTAFAGGIIPAGLINPVSRAILAALPANQPGLGNNFAANVPYTNNSSIADAKLDYRFSNALTGFVSYGTSYISTTQGSVFGPTLGGLEGGNLRNHYASLSLVGNYHGILGELRFGYNRYRNSINDFTAPGTLGPVITAFGGTLPPITITGLGTLGVPAGLPGKDIDNLYEGAGNFRMYRGPHQIVFGVNVRSDAADGWEHLLLNSYGPRGGFIFGPGPTMLPGTTPAVPGAAFINSVAAFLLGTPSTSGVITPSVIPSFHQYQYGAYIGDTWRVTPRVAIDIGLRYEAYGPVETRSATGAQFFTPGTPGLTTSGALNQGNYSQNNFSPRIGIAARATEHTVFRLGYAVNHFELPFVLSGLNPAVTGSIVGVAGSFGVLTTTPAGATPNIPLYTRSNFHTPYTQNYYAMIEQDLPGGFLFDVGYVGNLGRQLPLLVPINAAIPGAGIAGIPFLGFGLTAPVTQVAQGLTSNYNALQTNITKRLSKGASFSVGYTFGKALDHGTVQLNPFNAAANYGPADWDRTHNLTISHLFALPVGVGSPRWNQGVVGQILANWEVAGIFHWATGTPYSVFADPTACACPGTSQIFANAVPGASTINGSSSVSSTLFSAPAAGTFGSQGRNTFRGPDLLTYDLSLFKSFAVRENGKLELRAEAYNLFNNTSFVNPANNISYSNFGQSSSVLNGFGGRTFVLGARILF